MYQFSGAVFSPPRPLYAGSECYLQRIQGFMPTLEYTSLRHRELRMRRRMTAI
jgi:hypothetical protein